MFVIDGAYHVLFTVGEICESNNTDPVDEVTAKAEIPEAIGIVKDLVKEELSHDEAFTTNRFFKDAKTKSKIQRIIASKKGMRKTKKSVKRKRRLIRTK